MNKLSAKFGWAILALGLPLAPLPALAQAADLVCSGCVQSGDLANGALTNAKIAPNAVGTGKIANSAVTAPKIAAGSVDGAKMANNSVNAAKLTTAAVTAAELAINAVNAAKIANAAVTAAKIADGAVNQIKLRDGAVTAAKVTGASVGLEKLSLANTVLIEDSGSATGNCTALRDALAGLTGPAAIQLGPGTFDCGADNLLVPAEVALTGAGRELTLIEGQVLGQGGLLTLNGGGISVSRLSVSNDAAGGDSFSVAVSLGDNFADAEGIVIREISASAFNGTIVSNGIFLQPAPCDETKIIDSYLSGSDANNVNRGLANSCSGGRMTVSNLVSVGSGNGSSGVFKAGSGRLVIHNSVLSGDNFSVDDALGTVTVVATELDGAVDGDVQCVSSYNSSGIALTNGTNGSGGCALPP